MPYGLQVFDGSGTKVFDSLDQAGGVIAGIYEYAAGTSGGFSLSQFPGRSADVVPLSLNSMEDIGVTVSTTSGFPVVSVATRASARIFAVIVW